MTNDKEEFLEKFKRGIRDVSVGQYNDKYINIGYKPLYEEMWNWIESKLKAKDEEIERLRKDNEKFQEVYYRLMTQLANEIEQDKKVNKTVKCKFCSGKGWTLDKWATCPKCDGVGRLEASE